MWGMARKEYLKTNNPVEFDMMLMSGEIFTHLETIQTQAQERYETLIEQKREALGVTEELKEKDWLKWVQLANGIQEEARQEVLEEMIYI
ncbi:TnpV protein [Ruminococcus sp.]